MSGISAVIITLNEEKNIRRCLESLREVVDEIIILDSFSSDATPEICRSFPNVRFQTQEWLGYAATKNLGHSLASKEYILSLDADEALSPELRASILARKSQLSGSYSFNRLNHYAGQAVRRCGWYPDRKIRLFPKGKAQWEGAFVHEKLTPDPDQKIQHLSGDLLHYTYSDVADHVNRANRYSGLAAEQLVKAGKKGLVWGMVFKPGWKFFKMWILKGGIRAGFYGWCIATITGYETFLKYAKAIQMRKNRP